MEGGGGVTTLLKLGFQPRRNSSFLFFLCSDVWVFMSDPLRCELSGSLLSSLLGALSLSRSLSLLFPLSLPFSCELVIHPL